MRNKKKRTTNKNRAPTSYKTHKWYFNLWSSYASVDRYLYTQNDHGCLFFFYIMNILSEVYVWVFGRMRFVDDSNSNGFDLYIIAVLENRRMNNWIIERQKVRRESVRKMKAQANKFLPLVRYCDLGFLSWWISQYRGLKKTFLQILR